MRAAWELATDERKRRRQNALYVFVFVGGMRGDGCVFHKKIEEGDKMPVCVMVFGERVGVDAKLSTELNPCPCPRPRSGHVSSRNLEKGSRHKPDVWLGPQVGGGLAGERCGSPGTATHTHVLMLHKELAPSQARLHAADKHGRQHICCAGTSEDHGPGEDIAISRNGCVAATAACGSAEGEMVRDGQGAGPNCRLRASTLRRMQLELTR